MLLINRNTTNEVLMATPEVVTALQGGHLILIDKVPTANPLYTTLYFAGLVETTSSNAVSGAQAELLGWTEKNIFIMRCSQNSKTEIANQFEIGKVFESFAIQIVDTNTPAYDGHTPRISKDGDKYVDEAGNPIYRTGRLVTKDELNVEGHKTIQRAQVVKVGSSAAVSAMFSL